LTPAVAHARSIEISRLTSGAPVAHVEGREVQVSISHDGEMVVAVALCTTTRD
jgi:phosphopantetheinyl transferase (holo-ACP synthase)